MRSNLLAAMLAVLAAGPAGATGSIFCRAADGSDASVALGIGTLPVLAVISARIEAEGGVWSMDPAAGTPVVVGQASRTEGRTVVDFTDPNLTGIVVELRLIEAREGADNAEAGTLRLPGLGVYPLVCEGP